MFKVKRGIPGPVGHNFKGAGRKAKYPYAKMKPGTYFEIPSSHPMAQRNRHGAIRIASTASNYGRRHGMKFTVRQMEDNSVRVYCTAYHIAA